MKIQLNQKVKIISFNGTVNPPKECEEEENYWKLIGQTGKIVQDPDQNSLYADFLRDKKVLILLDNNVKSFNLHCHNNIENSLWFSLDDLEILKI